MKNTVEYELQSILNGLVGSSVFATCYEKMSKRVEHITFRNGGNWETMHGSIIVS